MIVEHSCARPSRHLQVVLAAPDVLATYWLAPKLSAFRRAHPGIELLLHVLPNDLDLAKDDVDIAILYDPPPTSGTVTRKLGWLHYTFYASPGYLNVHGMPADHLAWVAIDFCALPRSKSMKNSGRLTALHGKTACLRCCARIRARFWWNVAPPTAASPPYPPTSRPTTNVCNPWGISAH